MPDDTLLTKKKIPSWLARDIADAIRRGQTMPDETSLTEKELTAIETWLKQNTSRCCVCGRFCIPADRGTPFGNPSSWEPPDWKPLQLGTARGASMVRSVRQPGVRGSYQDGMVPGLLARAAMGETSENYVRGQGRRTTMSDDTPLTEEMGSDLLKPGPDGTILVVYRAKDNWPLPPFRARAWIVDGKVRCFSETCGEGEVPCPRLATGECEEVRFAQYQKRTVSSGEEADDDA
ncbi:MAG: hypothetical protein C4521_12405 [Actinobacteria bacterium]|nr:MAG: hypothetical protein C4521_12405 [Actinomycetota bacterium]